MKTSVIKIVFFLYLVLTMVHTGSAQTILGCGNGKIDSQFIAAHPEVLLKMDSLEKFTKNYIATQSSLRSVDTPEYIIPVVFHIIHNYGAEDIADTQVLDEMRILNEDYNKLNPDTSAIIPQFKSIAANCHMTFKLAQIDPNGDCTTGIEHIHDLITYDGNDGAKIHDWARDKYLNIWVTANIKIGSSDVAGYAYYPSEVDGLLGAPYDGVIILSNFIGSIGTGIPYDSRALTHEIGHTMNLEHPWGLTNSPGVACGDDNVGDTPPTEGWFSNCDLSGSICNPPVIENVQNYMDYSYCSKMFTNGQKSRMYAALNGPQADRTNLWSSANLAATGVDGSVLPGTCAPKADFKVNNSFVCEGSTALFTDVSWNGAETSRVWTFGNGTPSTSTSKTPLVTFNTPGWQTVTLVAINANGTDTMVQNNYIYVSPSQVDFTPPFVETFDDSSRFNNQWFVINPEGNAYTWKRVTNAGYDNKTSAMLYNYGDFNGDFKDLISPSFDLSAGGTFGLSFNYSCATQTSNPIFINDTLRIYISTNCGAKWIVLKSIIGTQLANAGLWSNSYYPKSSGATWSYSSLQIPSVYDHNNVRFKFEFASGGSSNNLFIDDVTLGTYTGLARLNTDNISLKIQPNPANESATISYHLAQDGNVKVELLDISGRVINQPYSGQQQPGDHNILLDDNIIGGLSNGVYLVRLQVDNITAIRKLVIAKN